MNKKITVHLKVEIPVLIYKILEALTKPLNHTVTSWLEGDINGIIDSYVSSDYALFLDIYKQENIDPPFTPDFFEGK